MEYLSMYTVRAQSKTLTSKGLLKRQHYQQVFKEKVKARRWLRT